MDRRAWRAIDHQVAKRGHDWSDLAHMQAFLSLVKVKVVVAQSRPSLCDPNNYSPSGSAAHGTLQARILEWVAIPFSTGSSWPRARTWVSCIAGRFFTVWATREVLLDLVHYWIDLIVKEIISYIESAPISLQLHSDHTRLELPSQIKVHNWWLWTGLRWRLKRSIFEYRKKSHPSTMNV